MPKHNLKLADEFAAEYDKSVVKNNWVGPEEIYNLVHDLIKPNSEILDVGIGTGESAVRFQKAGHKITGIDGSERMLEVCKKKNVGKKLIMHDLEEVPIPLENNCFDGAISCAVFHLINPLKPIFAEIKRLLKNNGIFVFTFENTDEVLAYSEIETGVWATKTTTGVFGFKYSEEYISGLLEQNNFKIIRQKKFLAYTNSELQKAFYFTANVAQIQSK